MNEDELRQALKKAIKEDYVWDFVGFIKDDELFAKAMDILIELGYDLSKHPTK